MRFGSPVAKNNLRRSGFRRVIDIAAPHPHIAPRRQGIPGGV